MTVAIDEAYQIFLNDVYKPAQNKPQVEVDADSLVCATYGELYYPSVINMIKRLNIQADDIFLDLGSGMGKLCLIIYLRSLCQHVIGVEAVSLYHQKGVEALKRARSAIPNLFNKGQLDLIEGNFLDFDLNQASIVYTCSTCFSQALMWQIGDRLNAATQVKQVVSLKPIANFERLPLKQVFSVECSWDSSLAYHYSL